MENVVLIELLYPTRSAAVMKTTANGAAKRVEFGQYIVADPGVCHGQPTFKGTRVLVWVVLEQLADGTL